MFELAWSTPHIDNVGAPSGLKPPGVKLVEGAACEFGHPIDDLTCAYCGEVRYRGSSCEHVGQPVVVRRRWDNLPLCMVCLRGCRQ